MFYSSCNVQICNILCPLDFNNNFLKKVVFLDPGFFKVILENNYLEKLYYLSATKFTIHQFFLILRFVTNSYLLYLKFESKINIFCPKISIFYFLQKVRQIKDLKLVYVSVFRIFLFARNFVVRKSNFHVKLIFCMTHAIELQFIWNFVQCKSFASIDFREWTQFLIFTVFEELFIIHLFSIMTDLMFALVTIPLFHLVVLHWKEI